MTPLSTKGLEAARVKQLEWTDKFGGKEAVAAEHRYFVEDMGPNWSHDRYWLQADGWLRATSVISKHPTLDDACAAGQALHETRILSALEAYHRAAEPGDIAGVVAGVQGLATQLGRMVEQAAFVHDGYVRVRDPLYLIERLQAAADLLVSVAAEREALRHSLHAVASAVEAHWQGAGLPLTHGWIVREIAHLGKLWTDEGDRAEAAEARVRELEERIDGALDAVGSIINWTRAYPVTVFPEPDFAKARVALEAAGITLDAVSASNMRHVVTGVAGLAETALAALHPDKQEKAR